MSKKTIVFLVIISIILGFLVGNLNIFSRKASLSTPAYTLHVPKAVIGENITFSDVVKVISPSVVYVSTTKTVKRDVPPFSHFFDPFNDFFEPFNIPKKWKERSLGSGVIVSSDGYIITNYHVVEGANQIIAVTNDKKLLKAKYIKGDPSNDIALLKVNKTGLKKSNLADSNSVKQGDEIFTLGYPFGIKGDVSFKEGTISRRLNDSG